MKANFFFTGLLFIFLFFVQTGCTDEYASGPEIEWTTLGISMTYSYSGGVMSGVTVYNSYEVVDGESGDIKIEASLGNDTKSCTSFVEEGEQYKVALSCSLENRNSSSSIILDSPTVSKPFTITLKGYSVKLNGINIK